MNFYHECNDWVVHLDTGVVWRGGGKICGTRYTMGLIASGINLAFLSAYKSSLAVLRK